MDESRLYSNQKGRLPRRESIALAGIILGREKKKLPANIIFTDDKFLKNLNRKFRRIDKPTDVLSFTADPEEGITGEIYISIDTARRQAKEYHSTLREEILRLVCHGALHLCGYDHLRKTDADRMKKKENSYLRRLINHD